MWIFSPIGFFSVVGMPGGHTGAEPDTVMVRSRERDHLVALLARFPALAQVAGPILEQLDSDYRFRIKAPREAMAFAVGELALSAASYNNFKGACASQMRAGALSAGYERALHRVWSVMADTQVTPPYSGHVARSPQLFPADRAEAGGTRNHPWPWRRR